MIRIPVTQRWSHPSDWIAVVLAVLGVIASFVTIPVLSGISLWLVVVGFVILAAGNLIDEL